MKRYQPEKTLMDKTAQKKEAEKLNEVVTNRLMIAFVIALIIITAFIFLLNTTVIQRLNFYNAIPYIFIGTAVLVAASLIYFIICRKNKKDEKYKTFNSYLYLVTAAVFFFYAALMFFKQDLDLTIPIMLALTISITLLVFVYFIYQREFFLFSLLTALGCFFIHFTSSVFLYGIVSYIMMGLLVITAVLSVLLSLSINKNNGYIKLKKKIKIISGDKKLNIFPFIILALLLIASCVLAAFNFPQMILVLVGVISVYLIIGIYYTIKLI